jgi:hypothetical protein
MTNRLDHQKVSLKKRIEKEAAEFVRSRFRTNREVYEQERSFLSSMLDAAIFSLSPVGFFDVGFVQIELYAHYGLSMKAAKKVSLSMANRIEVPVWEE